MTVYIQAKSQLSMNPSKSYLENGPADQHTRPGRY